MAQKWELMDPEGVVRVESLKSPDRTTTLEGKTVVLRWNGKPNGDIFLNRIAELLSEKVKGLKIVKAYDLVPEISVVSHDQKKAEEIAKKLLSFKPDLVISSQGD